MADKTDLKVSEEKSFIKRAAPYVMVTGAMVLLLFFFLLAMRVLQ